MNKRNTLLIASLAALAVGAGFAVFRAQAPGPTANEIGQVAPGPVLPLDRQQSEPAPAEAGETPGSSVGDYDPEQDDGQVAFKADANGRIVMNEKTRLDLERLYALYTPAERERKMTEIAGSLPSEASRQLYELMGQYQNYQEAVYQVYPPERELTTVEQGVSQIDGMHGLRVQHFGEQAAVAMFGAEEKLQRELYRQMEQEKDPSLTLEEKAERAQRIYEAEHPGQGS